MSTSGAGQQPQNVYYSGAQPPPLSSDGGLLAPTGPLQMRNKEKRFHGKHHVPESGGSVVNDVSTKYATMRGTTYLKEGVLLHACHSRTRSRVRVRVLVLVLNVHNQGRSYHRGMGGQLPPPHQFLLPPHQTFGKLKFTIENFNYLMVSN